MVGFWQTQTIAHWMACTNVQLKYHSEEDHGYTGLLFSYFLVDILRMLNGHTLVAGQYQSHCLQNYTIITKKN